MTTQIERLMTHFKEVVNQNQLAHGYLFTGDGAEAKNLIVKRIIQMLGCSNKEDGAPCGQCQFCKRIEANQYPDVVYLEPDGQWIRVNQIRELREWLVTSPVEGHFKVAVIEEAEAMNPAASNALLTALEEPVPGVYLFLLTQNAANLLPTITSRVQTYHLNEKAQENRLTWLVNQGVNEVHASILMQLSSDVQSRMLDDYSREEMDQYFDALNYFFSLLLSKKAEAFVAVQIHLKAYLSTQQALDSLDYLLLLVHSSLVLIQDLQQVSSGSVIQSFYLKELLNKVNVTVADLLVLNQALLEAKKRLMANVSGQLVFEQLTLEICQF